jgi:hypothetical protein
VRKLAVYRSWQLSGGGLDPFRGLLELLEMRGWVAGVEFAIGDHSFMRFTGGMTHAFDIDCASEEPDSHGICTFEQKLELERASYAPYFGIAAGLRFPEAPSSKPRYTIPTSNSQPSFIVPY